MKLNDKHKLFCREYLKDLNITQAAIRAGYSKKTANQQGSRLFANVKIQEYIDKLKRQRMERADIDADYVLRRLHEIDNLDIMDIMNEDMSVKPLNEWPKEWRTSISGAEISEIFERSGDEKELIGYLKKIKWPDKTKNLELLGRHVSVQAFKDKTEVEVVDRAEILARARKRADGK